jgi:hypothetical protein
MFRARLLALAAAALFTSAPAGAGTLIASGDATTAFRLGSGIAGNVQFARNILGTGTQVSVFGESTNFNLPAQIVNAYNTFSGVSATSFTGPITQAQLGNTDLFFVFFPFAAFDASEITVMRDFLFDGGTLVLAGEAPAIGGGAQSNAFLNDLLEGLGSSMLLNNVSLDISDQFAVGNEIVANPLTAGVTNFGYGFTTTVNGGTPLFLTNDLLPFVSVEAIPEPATAALVIGGLAMAGVTRRRKSKHNMRA